MSALVASLLKRHVYFSSHRYFDWQKFTVQNDKDYKEELINTSARVAPVFLFVLVVSRCELLSRITNQPNWFLVTISIAGTIVQSTYTFVTVFTSTTAIIIDTLSAPSWHKVVNNVCAW